MKGTKTIVSAVGERFGGRRPSRWRASVAATTVGAAVGVTVYRVLRDN